MTLDTEGMSRQARALDTGEAVVIGDPIKMSKSKHNVVAPADIADAWGVDTVRLFVLSDSPPERDVQWTTAGAEGAWRLINRVWQEFQDLPAEVGQETDAAKDLRRTAHRTIKAVEEAIEGFRFNSGVARIYEFVAALKACPREPGTAAARLEALSAMARLISPYAPHLAEACWETLGENGLVSTAPWPKWEAAWTEDDERTLPVQINGKRRGEIKAPAGASPQIVEQIVREDAEIIHRLEGLTLRKIIVVPDRIVNLVAN